MATFVDHYAVLGVNSTVASATIRKVYRQLALQYHPNKAVPGGRSMQPNSSTRMPPTRSFETSPRAMSTTSSTTSTPRLRIVSHDLFSQR